MSAKDANGNLKDKGVNVKSETQLDLETGWRLSANAVEKIFAWKMVLFQNLECLYMCVSMQVCIHAWVCSIYKVYPTVL